MRIARGTLATGVLAAVIAANIFVEVRAQAYPSKPIRTIMTVEIGRAHV